MYLRFICVPNTTFLMTVTHKNKPTENVHTKSILLFWVVQKYCHDIYFVSPKCTAVRHYQGLGGRLSLLQQNLSLRNFVMVEHKKLRIRC